ncbi:hypothetical protein GCM10010503_54790 [Streptomyces lucensis JCM 4490]|uniref:Uncharacterized protein n=1 Tax=Streptomyces lucensis JCM 4490 TaxID=1306176 RepID=A0A918MUE7_9ACTN|nr:hypothetical protein GCM10010503_54790 [Streptomyces lucensis JCM 4490]
MTGRFGRAPHAARRHERAGDAQDAGGQHADVDTVHARLPSSAAACEGEGDDITKPTPRPSATNGGHIRAYGESALQPGTEV